ncbi:MAG: hypothetical protein EBU88_12240 [Acidobacteria bacterium]|nr:hypothetical protein [Acidobacteriota bacterium]
MPSFVRISFLSAILVIVSLSAVAEYSSRHGQSGDQISGKWEISMNTPGGVRTYNATFRLDGERLAGEIERSTGNVELKGTVKGAAIEFAYTINYQGNPVEVSMAGRVDGGTAGGTVSFNGNPAEEWSARRLTTPAGAAPSATASAPKIDLTGTWNLEVETAQGSGRPTLVIKQSGDGLSGQYQGMLGEAPLTGRLNGNQFELSFKVSGQVEGTVVYNGTTDGTKMQGKVSLAGIGEGTFTGQRGK